MFNLGRAFEINSDGLLIEEGAGILSGAASPVSISMDRACFYLRTNGEIYYHTGVGAWQLVSASSAGFDEDLLLADHTGEMLVDNEMNILKGV